MAILGTPFGWVMRYVFEIIPNYGLALLVFTLLTRLIMIPVAIKQTKSSAKMALVQPEMKEIQKKYAGNRTKINEETMALYSRVGYNPVSGCLPMLVQLVILFGVIDVIFRPMTHILRMPSYVIDLTNEITRNLDAIADFGGRTMMNALELSTLNALDLGIGDYSAVPANYLAQMYEFVPQMHFLGMNLMATPSTSMLLEIFTAFNPILLIPILSGITSLMLSLATMNQMMQPQMAGAPNMKFMMYMMPVFSLFFTFTVPAGVGIYWIYANVVGFVQARVLYKFFNPKEMAEKHRQQMEEHKERERLERIEAKKKAKERGETGDSVEGLNKKELARRKLAEARRRDAEKYGEGYEESDDD